jgi:dolichyl-phosphate beta-glucosyltransferase
MRLSIIIPAYNEERRLPSTLAQLESFFRGRSAAAAGVALAEVIVVDDGSQDGTSAVIRSWNGRLPVRGIRFEQNRGKGAAARAGMLAACGDCCLLYDADAATPPAEIAMLAATMSQRQSDVVIGSRVLGARENLVSMQWHRRLIGRIYTAVCSALVPGIEDMACGAKLFTRESARDLFSRQKIDRFAFDIEVLSLAQRLGYSVIEMPVRWEAIAGSKVNLVWDSLQMLWCVLKLYGGHMGLRNLGGPARLAAGQGLTAERTPALAGSHHSPRLAIFRAEPENDALDADGSPQRRIDRPSSRAA